MNILFNSKIILKNNIGGKSKVCRNHCAFIKSQHINFSISNEKHNIKKNELAKNTNTGFIELYHKLLETKQIEKDPFQYKFILVLQAFENNLNNYYHHVEKKVENDKTSKKSFFSSFFKSEKKREGEIKGKDMEEEEEVEESEEELGKLKNDDNFFIFDDKIKIKKEENKLRYECINNENSYNNNINSCINIEKENGIKYVRGIYVYGSVGRGKTYFLNLVFDRIKIGKLKIHYHNFMQKIHKDFHEEKLNNSEQPIKNISIKMSKKYKLIFIDEFQIVHISDAMLIKSLFKHLFYQGTILICSSNRNPLHLYHNGLNRERFIPFIKLLFKFNYIYEINNYHDFRLRNSNPDNNIYNVPSKKFEEIKKLCVNIYMDTYKKNIDYVKNVEKINHQILVSNYKKYIIPYNINNYAIFSFKDLCCQNSSIDEYNAISKENNTIFIYDIEKMNEEVNGNEMRRFILLIDILYEKNTRVFFFSNIPIFQIFQTNSIISDFQNLIEKMKNKFDKFNHFKNHFDKQLKSGTFNRLIFSNIVHSFGISQEICNKLFDAINYNINKEYIPIEYLRNILCFHIINYENNIKENLNYFEDSNVELKPIPYLLFDENDIDTSQENAFASMRTLSRIKHMCTIEYLEKHKKLYENEI
ncbi:AFG1-like ATPase, putative [Plasmodium yoelii]|uniref:AFG1-like ATPase n=2 Tax=Plasmodium yoelii TaxID=5861 RepID=A0AAE9WSB7_PLAYO|nr:AFG1-like ATPase, putative [Plasmodium yoelii]WBY59433.1 AFG1-like ATPase [Plasmodium yoelii yoelii]CDU19560.1 nucleotide binding protein, putative [Plasmodium yoelii]VTZ80196.1 AFG1-like ATPase, putative [Plasmodium yoelii]|eukprot:XP_022812713.1 AFG1-like ATPase, putative [Plasmodium yoelii]